MLDEAYREYVRDAAVPDGLELYRDRPNVAVLRTFSKAYGLAGLRVGFAVAHEPVAAALRKTACRSASTSSPRPRRSRRCGPRTSCSTGSGAGRGARPGPRRWQQGWTVPDTQANFVWLRLGERTMDFAATREAAGVVVRPFAGEGARVTIGDPEANDILLRVTAEFRDSAQPAADPAGAHHHRQAGGERRTAARQAAGPPSAYTRKRCPNRPKWQPCATPWPPPAAASPGSRRPPTSSP